MENLVIGSKYANCYYVTYPYGSQLNFFATSPTALKDGLKYKKHSYQPKVYELITWTKQPKFKVLAKKDLEVLLNTY